MKKVLGLLILLVIVKNVSAQDYDKIDVALRATPMLMITKVDVDDPAKYTAEKGTAMGFGYGMMVDYFFAENLGLSFELRHVYMGSKFTVVDHTGSGDSTKAYKLNMQFLELPVTLKMRTKEIGYMKYFGQFGFVPSFRLKAKEDVTTTYNSTTETKKGLKANDKTIPIGMGLLIGAGAIYNLGGSTSLMGGLSFTNGFTNLAKVKSYNAKVKPAVIALNLGVIF